MPMQLYWIKSAYQAANHARMNIKTDSHPPSQNPLGHASKSRGTVRLINAVFYAHHGVMQEEHRIGGRFEVDVSMHFDFTEAGETDKLSSTVDYEGVYNLVQQVVLGHKFYLIEKIAYVIGHALLDAFSRIEEVEVTVRKHNPPVGGTCDRTEAVFRSAR